MNYLAQSIRAHIGIFAVLFGILFTASFSHFFLIDKSLRLDEAQTMSQTSHTFMGTVDIIARDIHVPLYFVSVRLWEFAFGTDIEALRLFSLLFALLSLPALYVLAREIFSTQKAGFVVLLAALSPFLHWFGSEARMYSMLLFFTILSQYFFMRLWRGDRSKSEEDPRRIDWVLYALMACLGMLTHYFFAFVLMVQAVFYFLHRDRFQKKAFLYLAVTGGLTALEMVAWFVYRFKVGTSSSSPLLNAPSSVDLFNIFSQLLIGLQSNPVNTFFLSLWPLLVLSGFTLLTQRKHIHAETTYFMMSLFLPIIVAFVVSATIRPLFLSRYLIICFPSFFILVVHFLTLYKKKTAYVLLSLLLVGLMLGLLAEAFSSKNPADENFRDASAYVSVHANQDDLFIVTAPFLRYPVEYYYTGAPRLRTFPEWNRYDSGTLIPEYSDEYLEETLKGWTDRYTYMYVLMGYDQGYEEQMRLYLDGHFERIETREFSPELTLYVYKLRYF